MYAEVVVLTYQAPDIGSFTYEIPKNLEGQIKIGQLVQVPFGKRNPQAIVLDTKSDLVLISRSDLIVEKIKSINSIIFDQPILLPYQIDLLKWMATYYFAPMVNCLEAMLPQLPTKLSSYSSSESEGRIEKFTSFSSRLRSNNMQKAVSQTLVLVPTITRIPQIMPLFKSAKNYIFYHNQLKSSERFENWLKILEGNIDFIFGSRSAIFAPCPNLAKIIIFDEHDGAYKDERSPYFDTLTVAEKLMELTGTKLEIIDSSPKITTYFAYKDKIISSKYSSSERRESRSLSTLSSKPKGSRQARIIPKIKIVSMADERQAGNKSPISSVLAEKIKKIHMAGGKTLLFLNKKAESGQIYCRACKQQNFAPKMPTICPNCQSPDIFFHSLNINSLAQEVKKIVPLSTCDISTSAIFYAPLFQKYDLVVHILTDSVLNTVDLKTPENFYSQISDLKKLTKEKGVLILQTYNSQNPLIKQAAAGDYRNFYLNELNARKMLLYPPYSLLVKLTIKGKKQDLILQKANSLNSTLQSIRAENNSVERITILGPYEPVFLGKTPRYNIILKVKLETYDLETIEKAARLLLPYIAKVPKGYTITVEPDNLN